MLPLTPDDLLPLEEYDRRRAELFRSQARYLDRYRRVRVGPRATLVFENRQTLWFRIQELAFVARLAEPARVQLELDWYNRLLPGRGQLHAALVLDRENRVSLADAHLELVAGSARVPAEFVTARPEDRCFGAAHWLEFALAEEARAALADFRRPVWARIDCSDYRHESAALTAEVRRSLLDDLALSDKDGELRWAA